MKNPDLLVIGETNFIYSIILAQDRNCGYLLDLASESKIDVAIPEFSFFEVKGRIDVRFKRREDRLKETISFLNDLMRSEYHKDRLYDVKEKLKQLYMESSEEKRDILEYAEDIKSLSISIPHSADIAYRAFIRDVANLPPYKNSDRQIYESILSFTKNESEYNLVIFYTSDKEDFDHQEIRGELKKQGVGVYFDSGDVVQRVMGSIRD